LGQPCWSASRAYWEPGWGGHVGVLPGLAGNPAGAALFSMFMLVVSALAEAEDKEKTKPSNLVAVTVQNPTQAPVNNFLDYTGTVQAYKTVDLVARVSGTLESMSFQPGSFVKKGELLFTIEKDTYLQELQLNRAQLNYAQVEYERQLKLIKENATSQSSVDQFRSQRDQARANTRLAEINLGYTNVKAPFDGRIGRNLVDVGNLVGYDGPTNLATIEQVNPAYVYFNVNERDLLNVRKAKMEEGKIPEEEAYKVKVMFGLQNETGYPHTGRIDYVDTGVTSDTGTLQVRALVENEQKLFLPGYFVRIRIPISQEHLGLLIPDQAIMSDQQGQYVYLVNSKDVVTRQNVKIGQIIKGLREIISGLQSKDRVIIAGISKVSVGQTVKANTTDPDTKKAKN
ncbi:MAG: efflux RND transporter periplasmic adaptor subunit, partial [Pseudomonadota bacterium]